MKTHKLEIKEKPIGSLKLHPKNPRIHPDRAIDAISKSIEEFGWTNPVLISEDGYILAGHARVKAARKAGVDVVPTIELALSGDRALAYLVADNRLPELTEWDEHQLTELLTELDVSNIELAGFDIEDARKLFDENVDIDILDSEGKLSGTQYGLASSGSNVPVSILGIGGLVDRDIMERTKEKIAC